ncbi:MAG TPA: mandelate racemase/muconate lactonizing enzyme family protein [Bryobacteraceae bacterium]|nr:mandelate racemase/muconate lactonizing enzyme family protein [Bryobacteraceae bacterium]
MRSTLSRRELLHSFAGLVAGGPLVQALRAAPASVRNMRFTRYEIMPTRVPFAERVRDAFIESYKLQGRFQTDYDPVFVRLQTDEGLAGIGEALVGARQIETILKRMIGRSPWEFLQDDSIQGALMAVYDVLGQATGMPICRLLSPAPRPRIIQTWWSHCFPPKLMASEAKLGASLGYRVHKVKARPYQDPLEQAAAICEVVPPDFRVWADANSSWESPGRAMHFIQKLAEHHNYFAAESPIRYRDVEGFRAMKGKSPLLLADHMGAEPMVFVQEGLLQAFVIGGPLGKTMAQRALMAEVTGIPLWVEYGIESGISQVFQAHQSAAYPGIEYTIAVTHCLEDDFMVEPFTMEAGYYRLPQKPGLGVTLDENAVEKYRIKA